MLAGRGFRPSQFMQYNFKLALIMEWHRLWCSFMTGLGLMWFFSLNRRLIFNAQPCLWCWLAGCVVWPHSAVIPVLFLWLHCPGRVSVDTGYKHDHYSVRRECSSAAASACLYFLTTLSFTACSVSLYANPVLRSLQHKNTHDGESGQRWSAET